MDIARDLIDELVEDGAWVEDVNAAISALRRWWVSTKIEVVSAAGADADIAEASSAAVKNSRSEMLVLVIASGSPKNTIGMHVRTQQRLRQEQPLVSACAR